MSKGFRITIALIVMGLVAMYVNHFAKRSLREQTIEQIAYAKRQGLCYAPIVLPQVRTFNATEVVANAAKTDNWKITDDRMTQITVSDPNCALGKE